MKKHTHTHTDSYHPDKLVHARGMNTHSVRFAGHTDLHERSDTVENTEVQMTHSHTLREREKEREIKVDHRESERSGVYTSFIMKYQYMCVRCVYLYRSTPLSFLGDKGIGL